MRVRAQTEVGSAPHNFDLTAMTFEESKRVVLMLARHGTTEITITLTPHVMRELRACLQQSLLSMGEKP